MTLLWNLSAETKKKAPAKKKAPVKKKKAKKEEPVVDLPVLQMLPPGTYMRENGILMLTDKFEMASVMPIVHQIFEYNMMEPELAPERITLMINSPGGRIDSCLTLIDAMNTFRDTCRYYGIRLSGFLWYLDFNGWRSSLRF